MTANVIQVVADRMHVGFMYSYPNYVPLSAAGVERIVRAVAPFEYEGVRRILGHGDRAGRESGSRRSAERYQRAIRGEAM